MKLLVEQSGSLLLLFLLGPVLLSNPALGQVSESTLRAVYPQASNGAFVVKPGVEIKAVYGPHRHACVLYISGPVSQTELMTIFETSVPPKSRGLKKID